MERWPKDVLTLNVGLGNVNALLDSFVCCRLSWDQGNMMRGPLLKSSNAQNEQCFVIFKPLQ